MIRRAGMVRLAVDLDLPESAPPVVQTFLLGVVLVEWRRVAWAS